MRSILVSALMLDYNLYPRHVVDEQHVHYIVEAMRSGAEMPPVVADKRSKRVIDGFHRVTAVKKMHGDKGKISVIERMYKNEGDMFRDAMRSNSEHGRMLTKYDRTRCIILAKDLGITPIQVAADLKMRRDSVDGLMTTRVSKVAPMVSSVKKSKAAWDEKKARLVPIKRTIEHVAGQVLTNEQFEVNKKLSGMNQSFYVNQLISLIESKLLNRKDESLMVRLRMLYDLLGNIF